MTACNHLIRIHPFDDENPSQVSTSPILQFSSRQLPTYSLTIELNLWLGPPPFLPKPFWWLCCLRRVRMSPDPDTIWCALVGFFRTAGAAAAAVDVAAD